MSVSEQITRIQTNRNTMRTKLVDLGLVNSTANLDDIADAVSGIDNRGAVSATVQEGDTYTIPKGYHNGSGTVSGVSGGGNYSLQSKTITPTKAQQNVTPDSGYYGLSDVTVSAIPENYQDVSSVTASAADVLANKVIVDKTGKQIAGTMVNNGAVTASVDTSTTSYTIPAGYHNGSGKVSVTNETKTATPTKSTQNITPSTGKVISKVTISPIPDKYQDVSGVTATADKVLEGSKFVDAEGNVVNGTMANNGVYCIRPIYPINSIDISSGYYAPGSYFQIDVKPNTVVTPTKERQVIDGNDDLKWLEQVTVEPIPDKYQDISGVTAVAADVLSGKKIIGSNGSEVTGTMKNNGSMNKTFDGLATTSVTIPTGYTTGGTVSLTNHIETALAAI